MKVLKKVTAESKFRADGNKLEFCTYDHLDDDSMVVHDLSAQMERVYTVGQLGTLETGEGKVIIKSFEEVISAWESGKVWF